MEGVSYVRFQNPSSISIPQSAIVQNVIILTSMYTFVKALLQKIPIFEHFWHKMPQK